MRSESAAHLILNVWSNSIYEKDDLETNPFTKDSHGRFYEDFNDALSALFADESFSEQLVTIRDDQTKITSSLRDLSDPPSEYKEAYELLKKCYKDYMTLSNIALDPKGSLNTVNEDYKDADNAVASDLDDLYLCL